MEYTPEDLKNMTDEELAELNVLLAKKVLKRFALFALVKWALIFGSVHIAKKFLESHSRKK